MDFEQAVAYVNGNEGRCVFAFQWQPDIQSSVAFGMVKRSGYGHLWVLEGHDLHDPDQFPFNVFYVKSRLCASEDEEGNYSPDDVPDDAKSLTYQVAPETFNTNHLDLELWVVLIILMGVPEESARHELP